jgi:hypothetical protein
MQRLRSYSLELVLIGFLLAAVAFFAYLGERLLRSGGGDETFSGQRALENVSQQLAFGPRVTGTQASLAMGDWLVEQLRRLGWDVVIQPFTIGDQVQGRNLIAVRSSSPGAPVLLLATPYDTRLATDEPALGANASASGVAVLLELARTVDLGLAQHTLCLAFLDAESNGGLPGWEAGIGSQLLVDSLPESVPRCASPRYVVGLARVGAAEAQFFQNEAADPALNAALWRSAAQLKLEAIFPAQSRNLPFSPTAPFVAAGLPTADLVGAGDLGEGGDPPLTLSAETLSAETLSAETLSAVGRVLESWLESGP